MNVELIVSSILAVAGAVIASFIWERKIRDKIIIKQITSSKDKDIDGIIEIYNELFPDDTIDYSQEEIQDMFDKLDEGEGFRHVKVIDILLAAKFRGAVVGFLFCHYYPERKKAIISYIGNDNNGFESKKFVVPALLKYLTHALTKKHKECQYLFFDVARPGQQLSDEVNRERIGRINLFMRYTRVIEKKAYIFKFEYHSPKAYLSDEVHERPLVLIFIPLKEAIPTTMSKSQLITFLQFIFMDCYGDIYRVDDPRFEEYQRHLKETVSEFETHLPEEILLTCNKLPNSAWAS